MSNSINDNIPAGSLHDFNHRHSYTPAPKVPLEDWATRREPSSPADQNASKELGRLAVFMLQNYPEKMDGRNVVDIAIELLKK